VYCSSCPYGHARLDAHKLEQVSSLILNLIQDSQSQPDVDIVLAGHADIHGLSQEGQGEKSDRGSSYSLSSILVIKAPLNDIQGP